MILRFLVALCLVLGSVSAAMAQRPGALTGGPGFASPLQPFGGVAPPAGQTWHLTLDDEFNQDTTINTSMWNIGHASSAGGRTWPMCNGLGSGTAIDPNGYTDQLGWNIANDCLPHTGTFGTAPYIGIEPGLGLVIQPLIDYTVPLPYSNQWATTQSWMGLQDYGNFVQRYGYFEVRAREPHDNTGEGDGLHPDIFFTVPSRNTECCNNEMDLAENVLSTTNTNQVHCVVNTFPNTNVYDQAYPTTPVGDLSAAFHTYAFYWRTGGSGQGTYQCYFDGVAQGTPYTLGDPGWAQGVYILSGWMQQLFSDNGPFWGGAAPSASTSNNNPLIIQYVRVWQSY